MAFSLLRKLSGFLLFFLMLAAATKCKGVSPNSDLDPARDTSKLHRPVHTPLAEQYIWTVNDAAALRRDHAKFTYRDRDRKIETHVFRFSFNIDKVPRLASLYLAGPRHVRAYLNGKLVLQADADPQSPLNTHVFSADVRSVLQAGANLLAIEAVRGYGIVAASDSPIIQQVAFGETLVAKIVAAPQYRQGPALAISSSRWRSIAATPDGWQSPGFDDSRWPHAQTLGSIESSPEFYQWNTDAGMYQWPGYNGMSSYLRNFDLIASAVTHQVGNFQNIAALTKSSQRPFVVSIPRQSDLTHDPAQLMIDFGREVSGRLLIESGCACQARVELSYGESEEEALTGSHYLGRNTLNIPPFGTARGPKSGFRYAWLRFLDGAPKTAFRSIRFEGIAYPVEYRGAFESSDPTLNRIWDTAAYTAHLCMQDGIWDAPKRDRGWWVGDLDAMGPVITSAFGDYVLLGETLSRLIPPDGEHVNGIPSYTALWITALADLYLHSGDKRVIQQHHLDLLRLLRLMDEEFDSSGHFLNRSHRWLFVDWSPTLFASTPQATEGTALTMLRGYERGAWLLDQLGDSENASHYKVRMASLSGQLHSQFADASGLYGSTLQLNAAAVLAYSATTKEYPAIWDQIFSHTGAGLFQAPTVSPYFNGYVLDAMAQMAHRREALDWMRTYWGGMIGEGATSFWEAYDLRWPKQNPHVSLQADGRTGYFVSLAHGWSSRPASWLIEEVLGITPVKPGYQLVQIRPDLMGLKWARGAVATSHGSIRVNANEQNILLGIPAGVETQILLPAGKWTRNGELVRGEIVESGNRILVTLKHAGTFYFTQARGQAGHN